jgi:cytochrome c oxidase subunit II
MRLILILFFASLFFQARIYPAETKKEVLNVKEIKVEAFKYGYDPDPIVVKKGDHVRLLLSSRDVTHGFYIQEYGIRTEVKKGQITTIEFTADKAGKFNIVCQIFCGFGHSSMRGTLIVQE